MYQNEPSKKPNFMPMETTKAQISEAYSSVVVVFYVPPTAKVIRRRDLGLKSHPKD